jgi:hypothetical protein
MNEQWRPIPGHPGHEVSDLGRVRSVDRMIQVGPSRERIYRGRVLQIVINSHGRPAIDLSSGGRRKKRLVQTLVLEAFAGARPPGAVCCHNDGDKLNNRLTNLRWDTRSSNTLDLVRHGAHNNARKTHCPQGHLYEGSNLIYYPTSGRMCRSCISERKRKARTAQGTSGEQARADARHDTGANDE